MRQITVRLPGDVIERLDTEAEEKPDYGSRADVIRARCASEGGGEGEGDESQAEVERLRTEVERLRNERRQLLSHREEHTELVEYAQEQRSLAEYQRERRKHGLMTRLWWFLTGEPD